MGRVEGGPQVAGVTYNLTQDEHPSSGQSHFRQTGGISGLHRALPLLTSSFSMVWEDPGIVWAFCSSFNSHVVQRMLGNYTVC